MLTTNYYDLMYILISSKNHSKLSDALQEFKISPIQVRLDMVIHKLTSRTLNCRQYGILNLMLCLSD